MRSKDVVYACAALLAFNAFHAAVAQRIRDRSRARPQVLGLPLLALSRGTEIAHCRAGRRRCSQFALAFRPVVRVRGTARDTDIG
jgi:hypothetical protein